MSYNLPSSDGYITLDGYVLTYVATNNKWEPKPSTASGGFTASGDLAGTASSQQVVSLTGSSNIVNVPSPTALEFGSHSVASTTGLIRLGDINNNSRGTQLNILAYRNTANTADIPLISTDGFGDIEFSGPVGTTAGLQLLGNGTVSLNSSAGNFQISAIGNTLLTYIIPSFKTQAVTGAFTFDSIDANLTQWDYKINGTLLTSTTTTKFVTKKGLNRAVRVIAASDNITTSDDVVIFSATGQIATLPATPSVGDQYTIGLNAAGTSNTFEINGNGNNIVYGGASTATITFTTGTTSDDQAITVMFDGTFWVAASGY